MHPAYPVLADDDAHLIDDASGHEDQQQGGGHEQNAHLPEGNPIRVQDGGPHSLCMFPVQIDRIGSECLEWMVPGRGILFLKRNAKGVYQLAFHLGLIPFLSQTGCKDGVGQRQGDGRVIDRIGVIVGKHRQILEQRLVDFPLIVEIRREAEGDILALGVA